MELISLLGCEKGGAGILPTTRKKKKGKSFVFFNMNYGEKKRKK